MDKIELTQQQLKDLLHYATGNVRDFVMNEDRFIKEWLDEQLILGGVINPKGKQLVCPVCKSRRIKQDPFWEDNECLNCGKIWIKEKHTQKDIM